MVCGGVEECVEVWTVCGGVEEQGVLYVGGRRTAEKHYFIQ